MNYSVIVWNSKSLTWYAPTSLLECIHAHYNFSYVHCSYIQNGTNFSNVLWGRRT